MGQKIADNYLSLKAYAVTASDKLEDYVIKGKGKNLSSLGDLLMNIAALSSVKPEKPEASMSKKGVLQVDKVEGHSGNWVFVNGHAVGLSNKLNDFEGLAVRMAHYEATLAKLTAALTGKAKKAAPHQVFAKAPEWEGD